MPLSLQVDNIFVFIRHGGTCSSMLAGHQQQVDLWHFDLESGVRVSYDVGYLCANFSLPRPVLELRLMYATDRRQTQTSDKSKQRGLWRLKLAQPTSNVTRIPLSRWKGQRSKVNVTRPLWLACTGIQANGPTWTSS